jgi:DNA-binding response OmpR family regulator
MPNVNGSEVPVRLIKEHGKENLKVMAITASVFDHQRRQFLEQGFDEFVAKPVRVEVVLEMVANLRGVTFEYEDRAEAGSDSINLGRIALPYEIKEEFFRAIETSSVTDIRHQIEEVTKLGARELELADYLQTLSESYDTPAIQSTLETIPIR